MADERLRKLERSARMGDDDAAVRLAHERQRASAGGWEAASAVERHLAAAVPSVEASLETLRGLRSQGYERGQRTTWGHVAQAARCEELAGELARAVAAPPAGSTPTTTRTAASPSLTVGLEKSQHGTPEPSIIVRFPSRTHFRAAHAALHRLASAVELATPVGEGWIVQLEPGDNRARLYLELSEGDQAEAQRGLALLRHVADGGP